MGGIGGKKEGEALEADGGERGGEWKEGVMGGEGLWWARRRGRWPWVKEML